MVSIAAPEAFGNKFLVTLQSDGGEPDPQSGADVINLRNDQEFFPGSSLRILTPFTIKFYGEDGQWHEAN